MILNSIDSFISVPLLVSLGLGVVLLLLLLIMKLRNTSKSSFIFFVVVGIIVLGSAYTYLTQTYFYFVFTVILAEVLIFPYLLLKAFDNPKKREEKLAAKKAAAQQASLEQDSASKALIAAMEEKHQRLLNVNKEIISKDKIYINEPMSKHTSFKIGGPAEYLIKIKTADELKAILKLSKEQEKHLQKLKLLIDRTFLKSSRIIRDDCSWVLHWLLLRREDGFRVHRHW